MKFVHANNNIMINVGEIVSIVDTSGVGETITLKNGREIVVEASTSQKLQDLLKKNGFVLE